MICDPNINYARSSTAKSGSIWLMVDAANYGGIERHVQTLAISLTKRGYPAEFVLYHYRCQSALVNHAKAFGAKVRTLDGSFLGLLKALRSETPALLHTHGYKANIMGRLAARIAGVPHIATFHSPEKAKFPVNAYYHFDNYSSFLGSRIAVSDEIGRKILYGAETIPNYIVTQKAIGHELLPRRVGLVGRLVPQKAPHIFCEIARRGPPGIEWHIYGDGELRSALETKYGKYVTFHGAVGDMSKVWGTLGLLMMPSNAEGLPLAALEALAAGVPVAATRVGGVPTLVIPGVTGWLFERDDLHGGLQAVVEWAKLDGPTQLKMRRSCWEHVSMHFSEDAILPKFLQAYERAGYV